MSVEEVYKKFLSGLISEEDACVLLNIKHANPKVRIIYLHRRFAKFGFKASKFVRTKHNGFVGKDDLTFWKGVFSAYGEHGMAFIVDLIGISEGAIRSIFDGFGFPRKTYQDRFELVKKTMLKKYGVEYPLKSDEIYARFEATSLERYGNKSPLASQEVRSKVKETCTKKYGCSHPLQSPLVREKIASTNLVLYGSESPLGSVLVREKIASSIRERKRERVVS